MWNKSAAEYAIPDAVKYDIYFLEITMLDPKNIDIVHTRSLLEKHEVEAYRPTR